MILGVSGPPYRESYIVLQLFIGSLFWQGDSELGQVVWETQFFFPFQLGPR